MKEGNLGLVLSGGGARGLAHVGVIKVMEELDLSADYVAGTNVGALVGALYAADHTADEMLAFFKKVKIFTWHNLARHKPGLVNMENFVPLFREYLPDDDFEALKRKLFVVATDLVDGHNHGDESAKHSEDGVHGEKQKEGEIHLTKKQIKTMNITFGDFSQTKINDFVSTTGTLGLPPNALTS